MNWEIDWRLSRKDQGNKANSRVNRMKSARAIIIGGGVLGLSTAYHLARKGFGRVTLMEKGAVGDGSSSRSAGIITSLLLTRTAIRVRQLCLELFRQLSDELQGYEFHDVGCINLFEPQAWTEREAFLPLYRELETPFEVLDSEVMRRRWPMLNPHPEAVGLFDPKGGYSEPHEYVPALEAKVRELGVEIREQELVTGVTTKGGRVTGVSTAGGRVGGDAVIGAVDSWARPLIRDLGLVLPVKSFVHQRYVTQPLPSPLVFPVVNAHPLDGYIRPAWGGRLLLGITSTDRMEHQVESLDFQMARLSASPGISNRLRHNFAPFIPALERLSWETESVGLLTIPMDEEPLLGPLEELPGLYVGLAFQGSGFAYNPAAGLLLAEFVADGCASLDVSAFSPSRFDPTKVDAYLATRITEGQLNMPIRRH